MSKAAIETCKIVIHGIWSSGRTTFIHTISERDTSGDPDNLTTVQMGFGRITIDQALFLYLFVIPETRRFSFDFLQDLAEGALGHILMIDSRAPETFREARVILDTLVEFGPLPIVIAANFQDLPDAWDVEALRIALQVPNEIPIVPCVATDRESVKGVLIALLEEVLKEALPDM